MRSAGAKRTIDELGRVVIPKDIRNGLGIAPRDRLNVYAEDSRIIIEKEEDSCALCSGREDLTEFDGKYICESCIRKLRSMMD